MDSSITQGYENTGNVADVNKQVPYSQNTMDYPQHNFDADPQVGPDGFHAAGDPYNVQGTDMYNPTEPIQHIQYQDPSIDTAQQSYYPNQDTDLQHSYIPEQSQLQDPAGVPTDNGINEEPIVENVEAQNSENYAVEESNEVFSEQPSDSNGDLTEQPVASEIDEPVKMEYSNVQPQDFSEQTQNGNDLTPQNNITVHDTYETVEQEDIVQASSTNNDELVKQEMLPTEVETTVQNAAFQPAQAAAVEETAPVETAENPEFTELRTYEPSIEEDQYAFVDEPASVDTSSSVAGTQQSEELELMEICEEAVPEEQEGAKPKQRRTRKPIHDLPMHLIGHDISKPVESVLNGRALPKPRLGVKVPYRNLTSQIVSKAELEKEIIDRSKAKEQASGRADSKFARSLTQRLVNKIAPEKSPRGKRSKEKNDDSSSSVAVEKDQYTVETETEASSHASNNSGGAVDQSKIQNDDDLLAILEGEGEEMPVLPKEIQDSQLDDSNLKLLEREIALQQLQELPHQEPKERLIKPRFPKTAPVLKSEVHSKSKSEKSSNTPQPKSSPPKSSSPKSSPQKTSIPSKPETPSPKKSPPADRKSPTIDLDSPSPIKKQPVEVEPQVKVNMVLKTYSRKRKPSDVPEFEMPLTKRSTFEDPDANDIYDKSDPLALPTDVYVTKSSRVIKKKVIWDPDDEQSPRASKPAAKVADTNKVSTPKVLKLVPTTDKSEKPEKKLSGTPAEKTKSDLKIVVKPSEKNQAEKVTPKKVVKNKSPPKAKRGLSEVDKLLMDEGAVNMMYDLKGEAPVRKKRDVYSLDKAAKDILKKANLLKNDLVRNTSNESPKSLRKKEGPVTPSVISPAAKQPTPILERKMSKDSTMSSVHTPPRSPTFFSSQASMLIRRRSSSSMSSDDADEDDDTDEEIPAASKTALLKVGDQFASFDELEEAVSSFQQATSSYLIKDRTRSIEGARKKGTKRFMKEDLEYAEIDYICSRSGKWLPRVGDEKHKSPYVSCPVAIKVRISPDGKHLLIKEVESEHSHATKSTKKPENPRVKKQKKNANNEKQNSAEDSSKDNEKIKGLPTRSVKGAQYKSFTVNKSGKHVSVDLNYIDDQCYFTIQIMCGKTLTSQAQELVLNLYEYFELEKRNGGPLEPLFSGQEVLEELTTALKKLEKDKECSVVSITSTSKAFCLGLDYALLVTDDKKERVGKANDLAESVRDFLLCLLHFPKVLVAGIQGECVGLAVTMLSLFDVVIASDTATFRTPYASLGCLGEATFLLMYPNLNSSGLAAELLYANQTLKADEAFRRGLISKLCWPEKYKDTLSNFLTAVANGSRQSLETTKRQLRANLEEQIEAAIHDEMEILIEHWTSPECQENFSKLEK